MPGLPSRRARYCLRRFGKVVIPLPHMYLDGIVGLGPGWEGYDYLAETLRSALPLLVRLGITTEQEADVDTCAKRPREEVVSQRSYAVLPLMRGAWVHLA
jgi:hypothetical protein